jgi:decaprenylphospho-beta-D-ribofuranose 2-oxidase
MALSKKERLSGWGQFPAVMCESFRPEKYRDLQTIMSQRDTPLIARGLGRSYGDAALQKSGALCMERLDHILNFDEKAGTLRAQAGLSFADLLPVTLPKGWLPPVIPGTKHVTLGGSAACNVHGKNQFRVGDMAEHIVSLKIMLATGKSVECSLDKHADLFRATVGGMGMTGVIEEVTLKLKPITSTSLGTLTYRVDSIEDMVAAFEHYQSSAEYMVGWIDHMASGDNLGHGVFEVAKHLTPEEGGAPLTNGTRETAFSIPFHLPSFTLNRYLMAAYNRWRFRRYSYDRKNEVVNFDSFFHPLDTINHWNRLYGRRGFFQYQCLLPETQDIALHLRRLLAFIQQKNLFSFLAVIKYHRDGKGLLTFSKKGYSLALDFPNIPAVRALLPQLDRFVAERGGRVYLAKDATLSPDLFHQMYGKDAEEWIELIRKYDPDARFASLMSKRLQWK